MINYLTSLGLKSSEAIILIASISTFIIGTVIKLLINYINSYKDRKSREREWKFKVYSEFFSQLDQDVDKVVSEYVKYAYVWSTHLNAAQNDDNFKNDEYVAQYRELSNTINTAIQNIIKSQDRLSLFASRKVKNAIDIYVNNINVFFNKTQEWFNIGKIVDLLKLTPKEIVEDFLKFHNDQLNEFNKSKNSCYESIRKDLKMSN